MQERLLLYCLSLLLFGAILGISLSIVVIKRWHTPGAKALIALFLAGSIWCAGYGMEIVSPELSAKLFWAKFEYFGIVTIPLAWFFFTTSCLGRPGLLSRLYRYRLGLVVIPIITLFLVWTNDLHHLIWQNAQIQRIGLIPMVAYTHGFWFYVIWTYANLLMVLGSVWIIIRSFQSNRLLSYQMGLVMIGSLIPWIGNLMYVTGLNPIQGVDWTPVGFTIAGLLFGISLFQFYLVRVVPIAHRLIFDGLDDCILVLDLDDHVIDLNPSAERLIQVPRRKLLGSPLLQALPELSEIVEKKDRSGEIAGTVRLERCAEEHIYDLHQLPVLDSLQTQGGRMIVLHDITQLKQEQAQLEQARARLEEAVAERTERLRQVIDQLQGELTERMRAEQAQNRLMKELKQSQDELRTLTFRLQEVRDSDRRQIAAELHDRVGQNLTGLNLNLQIIANQIGPETGAAIRSRLDDSLNLVEETTREVRDVMADLRPPMLDEFGLASALRWYGSNFNRRTGVMTKVLGDEFDPRLPANAEIALFRLVQEALNNVAKHARAAQVVIALETSQEVNCLKVKDDGAGFDPQAFHETAEPAHWGLINMKQHAASIGGQMQIDSAPGEGTLIAITIPKGE